MGNVHHRSRGTMPSLSALTSLSLRQQGAILLVVVVSTCSHSFGSTFEFFALGECSSNEEIP